MSVAGQRFCIHALYLNDIYPIQLGERPLHPTPNPPLHRFAEKYMMKLHAIK